MTLKTQYFSPQSIDEQAQRMLQNTQVEKENLAAAFKADKSALLVLDMQDYFLDPASHAFIPSAPAIVPKIKGLIQAYYTQGLPVIFTQHLNTRQDAGSMARWWKDLILVENPLSALIPDFDFSNRFVLRKTQYDAFHQTNLEEKLQKKGVTQVVISGVMTHLCCETTARSAFIRGFDVFFVVDGTATYNQDHHQATLRNLSHGFATLMLSTQIRELLAKQKEV
ncbi:MAG: isochorismatase family protein [Chloroflexota bacterium]|nr:MAG: isochorismatase family protein [Chloroflexota bacterium]